MGRFSENAYEEMKQAVKNNISVIMFFCCTCDASAADGSKCTDAPVAYARKENWCWECGNALQSGELLVIPRQ